MADKEVKEVLAEAKVFFDKAEAAGEAGDFDQAIGLYIDGLRCAPDAVHEGHIKLREWGLRRQAEGGQKPSKGEVEERLRGETALERMLNAEYLLAKDPGCLPYAEALLKAAVAGGYKGAAKWIADLVFLANNNARRPSLNLYVLLRNSYAGIGNVERAFAACECAAKLRPDDKTLAADLKKLSDKLAAGESKLEEVLEEPEAEEQEEGEDDGAGEIGEGEDAQTGAAEVGGRKDWTTSMPGEIDPALARATGFFSKARQVAELKDFDYAIELYLKGLRCTPDALHEGHIPLCEMGLERQRKGGKKPSMVEKMKRLRGKTPVEQMLNSEYLFVKDPDNLSYAGGMLKAAIAGGFTKTANWIANYLFQSNNTAKKPSFQIYVLLKNSYVSLGQFDKALAACRHAARLKPDDGTIAEELKNLTAEFTVARGRYDQEGDFRKAIKDRDVQERLQRQESVVKTRDYRIEAVEEARKALAEDPDLPKNIYGLAQALAELRDDRSENEAIELLEQAYLGKSDFSYKQRAGQVRINQLKRKTRRAKRVLESKAGDAAAEAKVTELSERLNEVEREHYRLCVENYPTDLQAKYEYGYRLLRNKQYDEAIPLFQEAQRDPRHKISAMGKIGLCFFMKGWFTDAIDVFTQAIDSHELKDDGVAKELRYNLGRSYEEQGDTEKALEIYRKLAQLDFGFRDVRERVAKLRDRSGAT
ncbi:MAG: tetratricopeptide repeat protein [Planctomycetota bacterium]|jgi:tetratricopeptide (TPR) repeat protein